MGSSAPTTSCVSCPQWKVVFVFDHFLRVVELNVEIICGSMPALVAFFHHHKIKVSLPSSLKNLFSRYANHPSRSRGDINMKSFNRVGYAHMDNVAHVETKIPRSKQGYAPLPPITVLLRVSNIVEA